MHRAAAGKQRESQGREPVSKPRPKSIDRLPPHSIEAEQGVLGCALLDPATCLPETVLKLADKTAFYDLRHQTIHETLVTMQEDRRPVDLIAVQQHLKDRQLLDQVGGIAYLSQLQDTVPSAANLNYYLEIVHEKHLLRRMIHLCSKTVGEIYDYEGDVEKLVGAFEREALALRPNRMEATNLKQLVLQATDLIEWRSQNWHAISGLTTGLVDLDQKTDGLHPGEFVVVAAYPSCGKTALMVNIAVHNALKGIPAAILSAEMRPLQLVLRTLCAEARVNFRRLTEPDIGKLIGITGPVSNAPLHFETINGFTISQVEALARRMVQQHGIKIFVVDYLQLLTGEGDNEAQRLTAVSHGLKRIAMEHCVPLIVGSQLNDDGKLLGSRTASQDGDTVMKLSNDGEWKPDVQPVNINVEKCRDGETGIIKAIFHKTHTRFESVSRGPEPEDQPPGNWQE